MLPQSAFLAPNNGTVLSTSESDVHLQHAPVISSVSVISVSYNRCERVGELLKVLRRQTFSPLEIILVDNGSTDSTTEMVRSEYPEVKVIETGSNRGQTYAYNLGFTAARGDYFIVIDDDGLPASDDWIESIVARFDANPLLGAICCTIRMRDSGQLAYDGPQFAPFGESVRCGCGFPAVVFNGTGAGLRAEAVRQVGGFPTGFFSTYLELFMCTKMLDAGWEVRHFPELEVWHSRVSGSSHPLASYYGLRNYYWYVWQLYPITALFYETLHQTGFHLKLLVRGQVRFSTLAKATFDAIRGGWHYVRHREPISPKTLLYLRWVRMHGNWHGLASATRPFDLML